MRSLRTFVRLLTFGSLLSMPLSASATGGTDISIMFTNLVSAFTPVWGIVAFVMIVMAGFTLVVSETENAIEKARNTIIAVIVGGILVTIIVTIGSSNAVTNFFNGAIGPSIVVPTVLTNTSAGNLGIEAEGVAGWLTAMAAMLGIFIIIIAVIRAVTSFGGDDAAYTNVRNVLLQVIIGLIIIGAAYIFKHVFFVAHEPSAFIALITQKIYIVLNFILIIAVLILVYAGFRMVISFGREEEYSSAKSLIYRVAAGILIILLSYSLVVIVASIF